MQKGCVSKQKRIAIMQRGCVNKQIRIALLVAHVDLHELFNKIVISKNTNLKK